ncbi:MAG: polysaccharide deacetylase family protein [Candidatus Bathyarchaeia archaeon]
MTVQLLLSFDDATSHNIRAVDLLEKYGLKACFYLDTDRLSGEMDENDVRELFQRHEIGGHTVTHSNLLEINHKKAVWEIAESKIRLEKLVRKPVESFAYPYGLYDSKIKSILPEAGYSSGRTTELFNVGISDDLYEIGVTLWSDPHPYRHISSALRLLSPGRIFSEPTLLKNWGNFAKLVLDDMLEARRGVMHVLVHARFIGERGEWRRLEAMFEDFASRTNLLNPTITEYLASIKGGAPV